MEIFNAVLNNWSIHQIFSLLGMFVFVFLFFIFASWYLSGKNKKFVLFSSISLLLAGIITILSFILLKEVFEVTIRYIFLLTPVILLFIEVISIGMILGFFSFENMQKDMKSALLTKEAFKDSLQITLFIVLLIVALILSITGIPLIFILITTILSIGTIWINFLLVTLLFKND